MAIYCVFCCNSAKKWQFSVYFVVIYAFFGINFILQKFCSCKKNDKYEVWFHVAGVTWILRQSYNGRNSWHWTYLQINSKSSHKSVFKISHSLEVWGRNPILRFNLDLNFWIFVLSLQTSITWFTLLAECQRDSS